MITRNDRITLTEKEFRKNLFKETRFDCEGKPLRIGSIVQVVVTTNYRYKFCGVGKFGKVTSFTGGIDVWFVNVEFSEKQSVECVDYHLRKIE